MAQVELCAALRLAVVRDVVKVYRYFPMSGLRGGRHMTFPGLATTRALQRSEAISQRNDYRPVRVRAGGQGHDLLQSRSVFSLTVTLHYTGLGHWRKKWKVSPAHGSFENLWP